MLTALERTNNYMDQAARPRLQVARRSWSAFQVFVYTGFALAIFMKITLSFYLGMSLVVTAVVAVVAVLSIFLLAMAIKIITGAEEHVFYQHAMAIVAVTAALLRLLDQPILPYLDITVLSIGVVSVIGRVGCFMVGCCHGRPYRWGVRYREEHAQAGFLHCYVGVRLFPAQLLESLWALFIVSTCSWLLLSGQPPGICLSSYVIGYGGGRFLMEFLRGDPERPYLWGFSEAQWTSLGLMCLVSVLERAGTLPLKIGHLAITIGVLLVMMAIALKRSLQPKTAHQLFYPPHVGELAEALELVNDHVLEIGPSIGGSRTPTSRQVRIACTSLGVQVSASRINNLTNRTDHYALSQRDGYMTEQTARQLSRLILKLQSANGSNEFVPGNQGVFHLLITSRNLTSVVH